MTEAEWAAGVKPREMYKFIAGEPASARKLRLLTVALYRQLWTFLPHPFSRAAIDVIERYADGNASEERVAAFFAASSQDVLDAASRSNRAEFAEANVNGQLADGALDAVGPPHCRLRSFNKAYWCLQITHGNERPSQITALLLDIFGNPFRPVTFSPVWLTSTVTGLASQMYDSRDFGVMPILADALQDAGCDNADILDHCRDPKQVHVRGCWVVDLVLGKT